MNQGEQIMQDRFKFRYVFEKDFGGKTGICYKMPVFNLDDAVRSVFENKILEYTNFGYKLIAKNQCTGLKDKNGKLIYEGDVVYKKGSKNWKNEKLLSKVIWSSNSAAFMISDENGLHQMPMNSNNIEILGNIYETPELIGGE